MPDKLTDNEIVKALECCSCETIMYCEDQCPFYKKCMKDEQLSKYALDLINRLQAENDRLKETIDGFTEIGKLYSEIKAEAYKEFAERLKDGTGYYDEMIKDVVYTEEEVDNLLKELVGEDKNDVKCKDCEYLELEPPYAVCSKAYKGIVQPNDSCGKGELKNASKD